MAVYKRSSIFWSGGVDISNSVVVNRPQPAAAPVQDAADAAQEQEEQQKDLSADLELRMQLLEEREAQLKQQQEELAALKERYIEQGKEVILDAKRRAEGIVSTANENAAQILAEAEQNRDDVYIKARAEGFEQGRKDGVEACLAAGRDVLDEAKTFAEMINTEKDALFAQYENDIYETVMAIARKVTLDSVGAKDGTVAKKLIKKAAKEFRNNDRIRITLDKNGATEELAADYEYLKELCGGVQNVEVELLPDAEPGTVIVESGGEITDAGIQTQLRMIQELGAGKYRAGTKGRSTRGRSRKKTGSGEAAAEE